MSDQDPQPFCKIYFCLNLKYSNYPTDFLSFPNFFLAIPMKTDTSCAYKFLLFYCSCVRAVPEYDATAQGRQN